MIHLPHGNNYNTNLPWKNLIQISSPFSSAVACCRHQSPLKRSQAAVSITHNSFFFFSECFRIEHGIRCIVYKYRRHLLRTKITVRDTMPLSWDRLCLSLSIWKCFFWKRFFCENFLYIYLPAISLTGCDRAERRTHVIGASWKIEHD